MTASREPMIPCNQEKWFRTRETERTRAWKKKSRGGIGDQRRDGKALKKHLLVLERGSLWRRGVKVLIWSELGYTEEKISGWWSLSRLHQRLLCSEEWNQRREGWRDERRESGVCLKDCGFLHVSSVRSRATAKCVWCMRWGLETERARKRVVCACVCVCVCAHEWRQKKICLIRHNCGAQPALWAVSV